MTQPSLELTERGNSPAVASLALNRHRVIRWLFVAVGSVLVGVGIVGVFLPLLPSTVFFLMAAACYGKSSPGAYAWLTTNRWFGRHLKNYQEDRGATIGAKLASITLLWLGIGISLLLIDNPWFRLLLVIVATVVTAYLVSLRTIPRER